MVRCCPPSALMRLAGLRQGRDYVHVSPCPDAQTVMDQLSAWINHYNEVHPHKALGYRFTPRVHRSSRKLVTVSGRSGATTLRLFLSGRPRVPTGGGAPCSCQTSTPNRNVPTSSRPPRGCIFSGVPRLLTLPAFSAVRGFGCTGRSVMFAIRASPDGKGGAGVLVGWYAVGLFG